MRRKSLLLLLLLVCLATLQVHAQETPTAPATPVVAFVVDRDLQTAQGTDVGPDGLSNMVNIFRGLGANVTFITLNQTLPANAKVVVFARPIAAIPPHFLARLWRHVENGNHLLLTLDPYNYPSAERATGGIGTLLNADYGMTMRDSFLAQTWFSYESIANQWGTLTTVYGDFIPNAVNAPLRQFDLPLGVWGARTMRVEPFGIASFALPLVSSRDAYAETNTGVFTGEDPELRLELNLEQDFVGRLIVGAMGINRRTNARIALLGDSEIIQNGFGLLQIPVAEGSSEMIPVLPGNQIFAERLAAWLLEVPVEDYPALPEGYTWLSLDGDQSDWPVQAASATDSDASTVSAPAYDIQGVRAFFNQDYLYMSISTLAQPALTGHAAITVSSPDGGASVSIDTYANRVVIAGGEEEITVPDARMVVGNVLEIRIPLRLIQPGEQLTVEQVCLWGIEELDCLESQIQATALAERDPVPVRFTDTPLLTVNSPDRGKVNLRSAPSTDAETITFFDSGVILGALGRNEAGDWIYVENARYSGWILSLLATVNAEIVNLPVITP
jgi:hypothetical protein